MLILPQRKNVPELLDDPGVSREELERSLSDLEWVNRWLGGRSAVMPYVLPVIHDNGSILDMGSGSGDLLRWLSGEAGRRGIKLKLVGLDLNPAVIAIARERSEWMGIEFAEGDARSLPFADCSFDAVYSSILMHHLEPDDVVMTFKEAARVARRRVVISDLIRNGIALGGVWLIGSIAFGKISIHDGVASFRRAYLPQDFIEMAERAGLHGARVHSTIFYRMTLVYDKEAGICD